MTYGQRLLGICQMAAAAIRENDPEREITWQSEGPSAGLASASMYTPDGDHITLYWDAGGLIDVRVTLKTPRAGEVTRMTILAAEHPVGDFTVAEALEAIL